MYTIDPAMSFGEVILYYEKLIDVSECAFFISKPGGDMEITYASRKFYSMLQYSKEEFEEKYNNSLMAVILPEEKQKVKNQYPSCISLQADTNSRLNRTIAQSYPVLCHPAIFISVQADALHEKLHQKKYHLPESLTSPPNVPLPLKKFLHSQSGRPT